MYRKIASESGASVNANIVAFGSYDEPPVFMSVMGYTGTVNNFVYDVCRPGRLRVCRQGDQSIFRGDEYEVKGKSYYTQVHKEEGLGHAVIYKKDEIYQTRDGLENILAHIFTDDDTRDFDLDSIREQQYDDILDIRPEIPEKILDKVYEKLQMNTPVPMLRDWADYIARTLIRQRDLTELTVSKPKEVNFRAFRLSTSFRSLFRIVSHGLQSGEITINGNQHPSEQIQQVTGLDSYLNMFKDVLAEKIQSSFRPRFDPRTDSYSKKLRIFDALSREKGHGLYDAQKGVAEAMDRAMKEQNVGFICGEMGVGKSPIALAAIYANKKGHGGTTVVLCPGHLVQKWKGEIEKWMPSADPFIVSHLKDLQSLEPKIKDKTRKRHLFLIMSKDVARGSYERRPAVIWSRVHNAFVCPECGQPVFYYERTRHRQVNFGMRGFTKEYSDRLTGNKYCRNEITTWNEGKERWETKDCKAPLWTAHTRDEEKWVKLPNGEGWVVAEHIPVLYDQLTRQAREGGTLNREDSRFLSALDKIMEQEEEGERVVKAPRKYTPAKYVKKYLKDYIDYLIADELHEYKSGSSLQGKAFGELVSSASKTLCLTGTLLNGYAEGIFHILYRCFPSIMRREGFDFQNYTVFSKTYGVVQRTDRYRFFNGRRGSRLNRNSGDTTLPGVSPLVFTRFLMETTAFIGLDDISSGLPSYAETPVPIEMDPELQQAYNALEQDLRNAVSRAGIKIMGSMLQALSAYTDTPYRQPPIAHTDTGTILVTPPELEQRPRNKEQRFLEIVDQAVANGEKVLVYYDWTNRTDLGTRLPQLLEERGYKSAWLRSESVSAAKREQWIKNRVEKDDIDVLICNPSLVETGLDLIDFTTIIFYQIGYNLFTMRQASRRSLRLTQTRPVNVYFLYYQGTIQERALSLMANKLQAATAIEGKFSEEGLHAMSNTEDLLTQIANSVVQGIGHVVDADIFTKTSFGEQERQQEPELPEYRLQDDLADPSRQRQIDLHDPEARRQFSVCLQTLRLSA